MLTHWKRPWYWERLRAGGEGDDRGWDGWMASLTRSTWIWVDSGSWWWTGRPDMLQFMGSQRVGHDWATELNWLCNSWDRLCTSHHEVLAWSQVVWGRHIHELNLWVKKIPLSRKWQPTPVFLPGKFHGQRSLVGYSPWGFSRQQYWSGLPCPTPADLPNPGIKPRSPTFQADSLPAELQEKP